MNYDKFLSYYDYYSHKSFLKVAGPVRVWHGKRQVSEVGKSDQICLLTLSLIWCFIKEHLGIGSEMTQKKGRKEQVLIYKWYFWWYVPVGPSISLSIFPGMLISIQLREDCPDYPP